MQQFMGSGITLFLGALLDALIGPNLFVPGEPFLIAAGYQLHNGNWHGVLAVILGGFFGDQISFFIGCNYGAPAQKKLIKWHPRTRRTLARCRLLMRHNSRKILLLARLLGPVAWIVPFLAGCQQIAWRRFTLYTSIGLFLGVGQFLVWGWVIGYGIPRIPLLAAAKKFIAEKNILLTASLLAILFIFSLWKYRSANKG